MERSCYLGDNSIEAARFFRREAFEHVGGYDEDLIAAEDWDLAQRIKKAKFSYSRIEKFIKHHEGKLTFGNLMRKKYQYGKSIHKYICKNKEEAQKQLVLIRPCFIKNYKRLVKTPVIALGFIIMKICECVAGGSGMIGENVSRWGGEK